jgi:hypothetical protein
LVARPIDRLVPPPPRTSSLLRPDPVLDQTLG